MGAAAKDVVTLGAPVDRDNCASEQIHLAGAVQSHGVLLCAGFDDLTVRQASANTEALFGVPVAQVLGSTLASLLGEDCVQTLLGRIGFTATPHLRPVRTMVTAGLVSHLVDAFAYVPAEGLVTFELELVDDGPSAGFEPFQEQVSASLGALRDTQSVTDLLAAATRLVKGLSGFNRVWAYRFEADGHGVVVAEEKEDWVAPFLGLHYPEGDIPAQARALFLQSGLRFIADVNASAAPLVPLVNPLTGQRLDLSLGVLRAVSPMHITYLANMGVRASMSLALVVEGKLWGLISSHHYRESRQVSHSVRAACEVVGLVTSMLLSDKADREELGHCLEMERHQKAVLEHVAAAETIPSGLAGRPLDLLGVTGGAGAAICVNDELHLIGQTPGETAVRALIAALATQDRSEVFATDRLGEDHPAWLSSTDPVAGLLAAPLSRVHGNYVLWFRPEWAHDVTWGDSAAPVVYEDNGTMRMAPRESFERWKQTVVGRSRPWSAAEIASAANLRGALGTFLLARAERLSRANADLAAANNELDAFAYTAAHDLKEPLRGIYGHATFLAEDYADTLDAEGTARLLALLRLSERMGGLVDTLLDYAVIGQGELAVAEVSVAEAVAEAVEQVSTRLAETGAQVRVGSNLPNVRADWPRLVEVYTNLLTNAAKYSDHSAPSIEVGVCCLNDTETGRQRWPGRFDNDEPLVLFVADNGIGIAADRHHEIFQLFRRLHSSSAYGGGVGAGLTIVRRIVERHGGVVWVESKLGGGSRFYFTLGAD